VRPGLEVDYSRQEREFTEKLQECEAGTGQQRLKKLQECEADRAAMA